MIVIYGLVDPRTDVLRYVGQTSNVRKRYWRHCQAPTNRHRDRWIRVLARNGLKPGLVEIERTETREGANTLERFWIASLRACGASLLNYADGGEGGGDRLRGRRLTPEHRAKISAAHIGIKHSAAARRKMSEQRKGRKPSTETRAKMRLAQQKRSLTWSMPLELREQIAEKVREQWKIRRLRPKQPRTLHSHPIPLTHGTTTGYRYGCRCTACRQAHSEAARKRS